MDNFIRRILIIDDDRDDYLIVKHNLAQSPRGEYQVEWAGHYQQGLAMLAESTYDAVLVDYDLGARNGVELIQEALSQDCMVPLIMLTGRGSYEVDLIAMQAGAADYLNKGEVTPSVLERSIRYAIERKRSQEEREQLLEENRHQRDLLERIMEDTQVGINVLQGPEFRTIRANPAYLRLVRKGDIVGKTAREIWPEIYEQFSPFLERVYTTGQPFHGEDMRFDLQRDQGLETAYFTFNYAPLVDRNGQVEGIVVTAEETTQKVLDRQALAESEAVLRSFFESEALYAGIFEIRGDDLYYIRVNETLALAFHLAQEQIAGKFGREIGIDEDNLQIWQDYCRKAQELDQPVNFEFQLDTLGRSVWFYESISPIPTPPGSAPRFVFVAVDVTERHRKEEVLEQERILLRRLFERMPVMTAIYNPQQGDVLFNPALTRVLGWTSQDVQQGGRFALQKLFPDPQVQQDIQEYLGSSLTGWRDARVTARDGSLIDCSWSFIRLASDTYVAVGIDLRERLQAQQALLESQALLQLTTEAGQIGLWDWDMHTRTGEWDSRCAILFGLPAGTPVSDEIIRRSVHPDDLQPILNQFKLFTPLGQSFEIEFRTVLPDGSMRWISGRGRATLDEDGNPRRVSGVIFDITAQKELEQQLEDAFMESYNEKNRLQAVMEALPVGLCICDEQGGILMSNWHYEQVWGKPPETRSIDDYEAYKAWWLATGQPLKPEEWASAQAIAGGDAVLGQMLKIERFDGTHAYVSNSAAPVFDLRGNLAGSVVTILDITERLQIEESLRESESRYRTMGETVPYGVWSADAQGRIEYVSQSILDLLGTTMEDIRQEGWRVLTGSQPLQQVVERWQYCVAMGEDWDEELELVAAGGSRKVIWSRGKPVYSPDHQLAGWVGLNLDITDRKQRERDAHFLASLGNRLLQVVDPDEVFQAAAEQTGEYLGITTCFLSEDDGQNDEPFVHYRYQHSGLPTACLRPPGGFPPDVMAALEGGRPVVVENTRTDPATCDQYETYYQPGNVAAFIWLPRRVNERWTGSLLAAMNEPRRWLPNEVELLQSVSNLAWLAADKARTQLSRKEAEERFRIALHDVPIVVFTQDLNLVYTWVYNAWPNIAGGQVLGKDDMQLFGPDSGAILTSLKRTVLQSGQSLHQEVRLQSGDRSFIFDISLEPLRNIKGEIIGLTGAALDITEMRTLEAVQVEQAAQVEVQRGLIQQRELERMDLARDLHDGPLQEITMIQFALAEAMDIDEKHERVARLYDVRELLRKQAHEIRSFCYELRPPALAPFGLEKAIRSHVDEFRRRYPVIQVHLQLAQDRQLLPEDVRMGLFRIYQEGMRNVARHSQASQVWVRLAVKDGLVDMELEDNGAGFDVPQDWVEQARRGHFGLIGMRERAEAVGATITFHSAPGQRTRVRVERTLDRVGQNQVSGVRLEGRGEEEAGDELPMPGGS